MQSVKALIERYSDEQGEFRYYIPIIEKAERNEVDHPDITIECCASLFQGISKSIVHRLDANCNRAVFDNEHLQYQVKIALRCLKENDDVVEDEFVRGCENLTRVIGSLRNARGDISHGRSVPKELQSDRSLARLVLNVSEAVLRYMLASFFSIRPPAEMPISYEDNEDFNEFLDRKYPLEGKPLYSLALYQQYNKDYIILLSEFRDTQGQLEAEE